MGLLKVPLYEIMDSKILSASPCQVREEQGVRETLWTNPLQNPAEGETGFPIKAPLILQGSVVMLYKLYGQFSV